MPLLVGTAIAIVATLVASPASHAGSKPHVVAGTPDPATGAVQLQIIPPLASTGGVPALVTASQPAHGAVTRAGDDAFTYTPTVAARHQAASDGASRADRTDTFTLTVEGPHGAIHLPVTAPIIGADRPPVVAHPPTLHVSEGRGGRGGLFAVSDPDMDKVTFTLARQPHLGTVAVNAQTGAFVYTPRAGAQVPHGAVDSFTVTVADGHGGSVRAPVAVLYDLG